ncbi:MAG: InlB B-repeat-containing protein [Bacilli bacterium]
MKKHALVAIAVLLSASGMLFTSCSSTGTSGGTSASTSVAEKEVASVVVKTMPTKTTYYIGETVFFEGGVVTIKYSDSTSEDVNMTDSRLEVSAVSTETAGNKNVIVKYSGKRVTFQIEVIAETFTVSFDLNYSGAAAATTATINKNETVSKPEDPTRTDYTFDGWFTTAAGTGTSFDFTTPVTENFTLYAKWLNNAKATYTVTFNPNFYGVAKTTEVKVEEGTTTTAISAPTVTGYDFGGWYDEAACTTEHNFTTPVSSNTTVYGKWAKKANYTGEHTYTLEAENVSLKGKTGKGLSGTVTEKGMIVNVEGINASGDKLVGYLYKTGLGIDFRFYSDIATTITLQTCLSQEVSGYTFTKDNYTISFNGSAIDYPSIVFSDSEVPATNAALPYATVKTFTLSTTLSVAKGKNLVSFLTSNSDAIVGTTMEAHAPLVDCIKVTANDAVIGWDANYDLPANL